MYPLLPQMPPPVFTKVNLPGIASMCFTNRPTKTILGLWDCNKMNMVWHEAVCPDCNIVLGTPFSHEFYVELIVVFAEKSLLPTVSTLGYMMGIAGYHHSCHSCHGAFLWLWTSLVNKKLVWCPQIFQNYKSRTGDWLWRANPFFLFFPWLFVSWMAPYFPRNIRMVRYAHPTSEDWNNWFSITAKSKWRVSTRPANCFTEAG